MPTKHALIIGIDQYSNFEERYQLSGCVNDARLIKSVLTDHFSFSPENITELHNAAASQRGILDAMSQLVERIGQDDIVLFHFSGHGSRRTSAQPDEGTGMDSTITPADSGCVDPYPNLDIIDDEIRAWLERLAQKTHYTTLIFDCCHSGTITRDAFSAKIRAVPADRRSLQEMGVAAGQPTAGVRARQREAGSADSQHSNATYVVMSGCRDDEYSHEYEFEQGGEPIRSGALTHFLTNALLRARPGSTYRDVFELARQGVNSCFPQQHPQIEGAQDREIFGNTDIEPLRFIPLIDVTGNEVTLAGGAAHGLYVNALWDVYAQGTKQIRHSTSLGTIEITSVGALTAQGKIVAGEGAFSPGARCVESAPAAAQFLLKVDLSQLQLRVRTTVAARLAHSRLLLVTEQPHVADLRIGLLMPGQKQASLVGAAARTVVEVPSLAVVDRAGELALPLQPLAQSGRVAGEVAADEIDRLLANLETIARYRNTLTLDNAQTALKVVFNIYRAHPDGDLENANGGDFVFEEGDCLAFEVINQEDKNVFVSVLDFGLTGMISLLYPPHRAGEMIAAGRTLMIGTGRHKMSLGVPAELQANLGSETLKAFISTDEADFRWLQQGSFRALGLPCAGLQQLFAAAYQGPATREVVLESDAASADDWHAPSRSFVLRRRDCAATANVEQPVPGGHAKGGS